MAEGVKHFYDRLASNYHLIFEDWDASIKRQAAALGAILRAVLREEFSRILQAAGFVGCRWILTAESGFYQPIVLAKANSTP
jgi:hypothetical protein